MESAAVVGIDLAKSVFQLHGAEATGRPVFRKTLTRGQLHTFFAEPSVLTVFRLGISGRDRFFFLLLTARFRTGPW